MINHKYIALTIVSHKSVLTSAKTEKSTNTRLIRLSLIEMYVTRPLSLYKSHPELLSIPPVEGPGSGYLVLQNDEDIEYVHSISGPKALLKDLPFPQNKILTVCYTYSYGGPSGDHTEKHKTLFIPIINQPLSSNCYYVMMADRNCKGLACKSSKEEDTETCCLFCSSITDKEPEKLNPHNICQMFEIFKTRTSRFSARSVHPEGIPPKFLREQGWRINHLKTKIMIGEADGLNSVLRSQLPDFYFPLSTEHSKSVTVGKWYCPFMFVVEGSLKEQMERSTFYEITLEQEWERIYSCKRVEVGGDNSVSVSVVLPTELVKISWMDAVSERDEAHNIMWYWVISEMGLQSRIGLSLVVIERMKWEQERVGWVDGNEKQVMVARIETYTGSDLWKKFGCYVLFERFVLKRLDGSLVLTYEFKHTHKIRGKWE